jgi:hypothetical protein
VAPHQGQNPHGIPRATSTEGDRRVSSWAIKTSQPIWAESLRRQPCARSSPTTWLRNAQWQPFVLRMSRHGIGAPTRRASPYAAGGNYTIEIQTGVVWCTVWQRPDVSPRTGAAFAKEKARHLWRLAARPHEQVSGLLFDLQQAPTRWGPITHEHLGTALRAFRMALKRIAVVVSASGMQRAYAELLSRDFGGHYANVFDRHEVGLAWVSDPKARLSKGRSGPVVT